MPGSLAACSTAAIYINDARQHALSCVAVILSDMYKCFCQVIYRASNDFYDDEYHALSHNLALSGRAREEQVSKTSQFK